MELNAKKDAIFKAINYIDSSLEKMGRHVDYILDIKKTPKEYQKGWFLNPDEAVVGMERLINRYHPKGSRNFRHYIVSFGVPDLSAEVAFTVGQKLVNYYGKTYPAIMGVHTDIPSRIHLHYLLNTIDVRTGKKFAESQNDFNVYRKFINDVLLEHHLPGLRGMVEKTKVAETLNENSVEIDCGDFYGAGDSMQPINVYESTREKKREENHLEFVFDEKKVAQAYFDGIKIFYKLGVNGNGK